MKTAAKAIILLASFGMSVVVGLFRSDVLYVNDIDIDIKDGDTTRTLVNNLAQYMSDRLLYGIRKHSERWACGRFLGLRLEHVEEYIKTKFGQVNRLHSENFLGFRPIPASRAAAAPHTSPPPAHLCASASGSTLS